MIVHFVRYANITGLVTVSEYCFLAADFPLPFFLPPFFWPRKKFYTAIFACTDSRLIFPRIFFFPFSILFPLSFCLL